MQIKQKLAIAGVLLVSVLPFLSSQSVQAATPTPLVQAGIENRCNIITNRVNDIITRYDETKQLHITRYQLIKDKVQVLITKLTAKGYDVSKLQTDLQQLNTMTLTFASQYKTTIDLLNESKTFVCGQSNGDFKAKIQEARAELLLARGTSLDIRVFINTTIRADIQALRDQVK